MDVYVYEHPPPLPYAARKQVWNKRRVGLVRVVRVQLALCNLQPRRVLIYLQLPKRTVKRNVSIDKARLMCVVRPMFSSFNRFNIHFINYTLLLNNL